MQTIYTERLVKRYGNKTVLAGIDMDISSGSVVGLMGKNGAGKTTLNRIVTGLSFPTEGEVLILGDKPKCGRNRISFLSENISIYPTLSAYENIAQVFLINNMKPDKEKIRKILAQISVENGRKKVADFSLGMKRRLQIAMSLLVVDRDIIILDEPTNGLDINGVIWLKEVLQALKKEDKTIIITTHAIREIEDILTHYSILSNGRVAQYGNVEEVLNTNLYITLSEIDINRAIIEMNKAGMQYRINGNVISVLNVNRAIVRKCLELLTKNGIMPIQFGEEKQSLVDIFMSVTREGENND